MAATATLRAQNSELNVYAYGNELPSIDHARSAAAMHVVAANAAVHRHPNSESTLQIDGNLDNFESGEIVFGRCRQAFAILAKSTTDDEEEDGEETAGASIFNKWLYLLF